MRAPVAHKLVALSFLLPACAGSRNASLPQPSTAPTTPEGGLRLEPVVTIDPGPGRVHSVVVWDHFVGWAAGPTADADPDRLFLYNLETKDSRVIARTKYRGGTIPRLRASKDSVVYVDMNRVASDVDASVEWHMYELSLSTGRERTLARSASASDLERPPIPSVAWPWVVWFQPEEQGRTVRSFDLRDGRQKVLASASTAGQLSLDDTTANAHYDDASREGRDVFSVPADGSSPPSQVTTSGRADFPIARNGGVSWQEPPEADSMSLWFKEVTAQPRRVSEAGAYGPTAGSNPFPGRGFVVWLLGNQLVARDSAAVRPHVVVQEADVSIPARWWVDGDRVAWATLTSIGTPNERSEIRVSRVVPSGMPARPTSQVTGEKP